MMAGVRVEFILFAFTLLGLAGWHPHPLVSLLR